MVDLVGGLAGTWSAGIRCGHVGDVQRLDARAPVDPSSVGRVRRPDGDRDGPSPVVAGVCGGHDARCDAGGEGSHEAIAPRSSRRRAQRVTSFDYILRSGVIVGMDRDARHGSSVSLQPRSASWRIAQMRPTTCPCFGPTGGSKAPTYVDLSCGANGSTTLSSSMVQAQRDSVHLFVVNENDEPVSVGWRAVPLGKRRGVRCGPGQV